MTALLLVLLAADPAPKACFDNLCGLEEYCSCHAAGAVRRCWSQKADCETDLACCSSSSSCSGTPAKGEVCSEQTATARRRRDLPAGTYPDPALTPGAADLNVGQSNLKDTICKPGYTASVRDVPAALKKKIVERYVAAHPDWPKCKPAGGEACEIDHLISLELGGLNDASNLFPQRYCPLPREPDCYGAREKDVVETWLHRKVCAGDITLEEAQRLIAGDWIRLYLDPSGPKPKENPR